MSPQNPESEISPVKSLINHYENKNNTESNNKSAIEDISQPYFSPKWNYNEDNNSHLISFDETPDHININSGQSSCRSKLNHTFQNDDTDHNKENIDSFHKTKSASVKRKLLTVHSADPIITTPY